MILENIKLEKVSPFQLKETIRVIDAYSAALIEPTMNNMFQFDLAKQIWIQFNKKNSKAVVPKNNKIKLKVFEAVFLLQIIDIVAIREKTISNLYKIKESIDRQLKEPTLTNSNQQQPTLTNNNQL